MEISKASKAVKLNEENAQGYLDALDTDVRNLCMMAQGRISFGSGTTGTQGENISGEWRTYTTNAVADTQDAVTHQLGATPIGFIVTNINKGGVIYAGTTNWSSDQIYLRCTTASTNVTLFLIK